MPPRSAARRRRRVRSQARAAPVPARTRSSAQGIQHHLSPRHCRQPGGDSLASAPHERRRARGHGPHALAGPEAARDRRPHREAHAHAGQRVGVPGDRRARPDRRGGVAAATHHAQLRPVGVGDLGPGDRPRPSLDDRRADAEAAGARVHDDRRAVRVSGAEHVGGDRPGRRADGGGVDVPADDEAVTVSDGAARGRGVGAGAGRGAGGRGRCAAAAELHLRRRAGIFGGVAADGAAAGGAAASRRSAAPDAGAAVRGVAGPPGDVAAVHRLRPLAVARRPRRAAPDRVPGGADPADLAGSRT